jgi:hypothetical protein
MSIKETMPRHVCALLVLSMVASAQEGIDRGGRHPGAKPVSLETQFRAGQRFACSNTVSYTLDTSIKQGDRERTESEAVERTERFVDKIQRAGTNGVLEIERNYLKLYAKARQGEDGRPDVRQSQLQGQTVYLKERGRRRDMRIEAHGIAVDQIVRRTAGMELDWRDVLPLEEVAPGDSWKGDASALSSRLSAYLNCGIRSDMKVRFEEVIEREGSKVAKLYVDWTLEGMRDRTLFTKVTLAGDLYFDLDLHRVVGVDLVGNMIVRGATIGTGAPRIVRGSGTVLMKTTVKPATVEASAAPEDE